MDKAIKNKRVLELDRLLFRLQNIYLFVIYYLTKFDDVM